MAVDNDNYAPRHRAALEALVRQDLDDMTTAYHGEVVARDHAQQRAIHGVDEFRAWCQEWLDAFPDSRIDELECFGAGEWTVARLTTSGTNQGALGPFPATNQPMRTVMCDVARWSEGRIVEDHVYYDMYGVLVQLGHLPAPQPAG